MAAEERKEGDLSSFRAPFAVLPGHSDLERNGWKLVRHCPAGNNWHQAADHLRGTEIYGDSSGLDSPGAAQWSVRFDGETFDEFLFATGDGAKWMVVGREEVAPPVDKYVNRYGDHVPERHAGGRVSLVTSSSECTAPSKVFIRHRLEQPCEPFVCLSDHELAKNNDGGGFLYGGGNFSFVAPVSKAAATGSPENGYENTSQPSEFGLSNVKEHGGANVYIRQSTTARLADCLLSLAHGPAELGEVLAGLGNDESMVRLWREFPQAVLAGVGHGFWRGQTVEWLSRALGGSVAAVGAGGNVARIAGVDCPDTTWASAAAATGGNGPHPWHPHNLKLIDRHGWLCDGRNVPGGCRGNGGGRGKRYKCVASCDYDLCQHCVDAGAFSLRVTAIQTPLLVGCLDPNIVHLPCHHASHLLLSWQDLDVGSPRVPAPKGTLKVRALLMDLTMRGLLLGPLRSDLTEVKEVGPDLGSGWKWCGAAKAPDGRLFFLPRNSPKIRALVFDPNKGSARLLDLPKGSSTAGQATQMYNGAVVGKDGCIYGIPANAEQVLKIDTTNGGSAMSLIGPKFPGSWKWGQGALAADGKIYCAPAGGGAGGIYYNVLVIDPANSTAYEAEGLVPRGVDVVEGEGFHRRIGREDELKNRWWGAAYSEATSCVYFVPHNATKILKFDPAAPVGQQSKFVGPEMNSGGEKYQGCCVSKNLIVASPANRGAKKVLVFDPTTEQGYFAGPDQGSDKWKWHDTVTGADGLAYAVVHHASRVLRIDASKAAQSSMDAEMADAEIKKISDRADQSGGVPDSGAEEEKKQWAEKKNAAEKNGVVENYGVSMGKDGGRYGCGALANDGFVYAAPLHAGRILRVDTFRRESCDADAEREGSMTWLWRNKPELWFTGLTHPVYGPEFLAWFDENCGGTRNDRDDDDIDDDADGSSYATAASKASNLTRQCGQAHKAVDAAIAGEDSTHAHHSAAEVKIMGAYDRAVQRVAALPGFLDVLLDQVDPALRLRLSQVPFIRKAVVRSTSVGPWILARLKDPSKAASVAEYFRLVSTFDECELLAVPWANLNPPSAEAAALRAKGSTLDGGATTLGLRGWGWTWWERFETSLTHAEWRCYIEEKQDGQMMTLSEAREVLKHQTLCPGENRWAAVLPDPKPANGGDDAAIRGQDITAVGGAAFHGKDDDDFIERLNDSQNLPTSPSGGSSSPAKVKAKVSSTQSAAAKVNKRNSLLGTADDSDDEEPMDWVQVGDLNLAPGTSHVLDLEKMPHWGTSADRTKPSVAMWKPLGRVGRCLLLEAVLDLEDAALRNKILRTKMMGLIMMRTESIGPWIVKRLSVKTKMSSVVDYLREASAVEQAEDGNTYGSSNLTSAMSELPNLLPAMLQLPSAVLEKAVEAPLVAQVLDTKLADRSAAVFVVALDLILVVTLLALYLAITSNRAVLVSGPSSTVLVLITLVNLYFTAREVYQIKTMHRLKLARQYWTDAWNIVDLCGVVMVFFVIGMASSSLEVRTGDDFRIVSATASVFVWMKVVGMLKVLNIKLATFVYSLNMIMHDLREFVLVIAVAIFMFSLMFLMLHAEDTNDEAADFELTDDRPFHSATYSMLSVYMMVMGQFERDWYQNTSVGLTAYSITLFMFFMFFVVIVMLNVLIAVVSDSYDYAMTRATQLFLRTRLVLVAELDALNLTEMDSPFPDWADAILNFLAGAFQGLFGSKPSDLFRLATAKGTLTGEEWTGRVLHMERSTSKIVDNRVEIGVEKILENMALHGQRLREVEASVVRRIAEQDAKREQMSEKMRVDKLTQSRMSNLQEGNFKRQIEGKLAELGRMQQQFEQKVLAAMSKK